MCVCVCLFVCLFLVFLGLHLQHMEVPKLGVELELQLPAYTTTTTQDPSHICNLHHSSHQHRILNQLILNQQPGIEHATSWFLVGFISAAP